MVLRRFRKDSVVVHLNAHLKRCTEPQQRHIVAVRLVANKIGLELVQRLFVLVVCSFVKKVASVFLFHIKPLDCTLAQGTEEELAQGAVLLFVEERRVA